MLDCIARNAHPAEVDGEQVKRAIEKHLPHLGTMPHKSAARRKAVAALKPGGPKGKPKAAAKAKRKAR